MKAFDKQEMEDFIERLVKMSEHELDDQEWSTLDRELQSSGEKRAIFADYQARNVMLRDLFDVRGQWALQRREQRRRAWFVGLISVAAGGLIAFLTIFGFSDKRGGWQIGSASGKAERLRDGRRSDLKQGEKIKEGDSVFAGHELVELHWRNEPTTLKLSPFSEIEVLSSKLGKRLRLRQGSLDAVVAPQPSDKPLVVETETSSAVVVGTTFRLDASNARSRLEVSEGKVFFVKSSDDEGTMVGALEEAVVEKESAIRVQASSVAMRLKQDLIAHWSLDNRHGNGLRNVSGTAVANVATPDWDHEIGLRMPVRNVAHILQTDIRQLPASVTISMWVKLKEGEPHLRTLAANSSGGANEPGFRILVNDLQRDANQKSHGVESRCIKVQVGNGQFSSQVISRPNVLKTDTWHHVVVCMDSVEGNCGIFVDGEDVTVHRRCFAFDAPVKELSFGGMIGPYTNILGGTMAEIRLYARRLSIDDILALAKNQP
jgi:ferric-dicitrate binding protein FerR (iron transport regulator)